MSWIRTHSDKILVAGLSLIFLVIGFGRLDYAGAGLRRLDHILYTNRPALGEARWVLFPLLLFAVLKPFVAAGIVQSVAQAAKVFCFFDVGCGLVYLVCLRRWLSDLPAVRRAAVLIWAGGSYVFLSLSTDTMSQRRPSLLLSLA